MNLHEPDPYPGRCQNVRHGWDSEQPWTVRCLDYEGTEHVCTFPEPPYVQHSTFSAQSFSTARTEPKPWVRP